MNQAKPSPSWCSHIIKILPGTSLPRLPQPVNSARRSISTNSTPNHLIIAHENIHNRLMNHENNIHPKSHHAILYLVYQSIHPAIQSQLIWPTHLFPAHQPRPNPTPPHPSPLLTHHLPIPPHTSSSKSTSTAQTNLPADKTKEPTLPNQVIKNAEAGKGAVGYGKGCWMFRGGDRVFFVDIGMNELKA